MFSTPGYPPRDDLAHDYLSGSETQIEAFLRSCSFIHGLFVQTAAVLKGIEEPTAEKFRDFMNEGMQFKAHGARRKEFYDAVKSNAEV